MSAATPLQVLTADRALLEAQLAHANAHIDGVERQLSAMRRQLAGLVDDAGGDGSPDACADRGALMLWAGDRHGSGACSANGSEVRAAMASQGSISRVLARCRTRGIKTPAAIVQ